MAQQEIPTNLEIDVLSYLIDDQAKSSVYRTGKSLCSANSAAIVLPYFAALEIFSISKKLSVKLVKAPGKIIKFARKYRKTVEKLERKTKKLKNDSKMVDKDQRKLRNEIEELQIRVKKMEERRERWKQEAEKLKAAEELKASENLKAAEKLKHRDDTDLLHKNEVLIDYDVDLD